VRVSPDVDKGVVGGRLFAYVLDTVTPPPLAALSAHRAYLRSLGDAVLVGGPYRDRRGAVVCVLADDERTADAIARADPLVAFGFTLYELHELDRVGS